MSRETSTILTNLCLIEDCSTNKVVLNTGHQSATRNGLAMPFQEAILKKVKALQNQSFVKSTKRQVLRLQILNSSQLKTGSQMREAAILFLLQSNRIHRPAKIVWRRRSFLGCDGPIRKVGLILRHASSLGSDGRPRLIRVLLPQTDRRWLGKLRF